MNKLIVGVAAALALMTSNAVADGPYRRPPPTIAAPAYEPPPVPAWTGFYIGAGIGAGAVVTDVSVHDQVLDERLFNFGVGADGVLGTIIVGWDWQVGPTTVFGVFADFDFFNLSNDNRIFGGPNGDFRHSNGVDNAWSIGARLGWLSSPSTLWYVTGGYTQVDIDHAPRFADLDGVRISRDSTLDGFFVGAGVDTRLAASNWFLRLEYRFSDFDTGTARIRDINGNELFRINADAEAHTARLTLTYKFLGGYGWSMGGR